MKFFVDFFYRTPPHNQFHEEHLTPGPTMKRDFSSPHLSGKANSYTSPHPRAKKLLSDKNSAMVSFYSFNDWVYNLEIFMAILSYN